MTILWHHIYRTRAENEVSLACAFVNLALHDAAQATDELFTRETPRFEPRVARGLSEAA